MAKVSILTPAYNAQKHISQTIESVQRQTFVNWELIMLDDCSTDQTFDIIQQAASSDLRIKPFQNDKNLGMMLNWNKGIELCKSEYFVKLDADDLWHPKALEEAVSILDLKPEIGLVCGKFVEIDEHDTLHPADEQKRFDFITGNIFSPVDLVKKGPREMFASGISMQGLLLMRRSILDELGSYHPYFWGDQELWFRIGAHYLFYYIPDVRYYYRKWSGAVTSSHQDYQKEDSAQKGFYDCRNAIFDYYYQHKLLPIQSYQAYKADTQFLYNSFRVYRSRTSGRYVEMTKLLLHNFLINPKRMLIENLHIDRLFN